MAGRRLLGVWLVVIAGLCAVPAGATAYVIGGKPWPHGVIRYYNAFPADAGVVRAAVRAWNTSGAHVRFVAVPRRAARVIVVRDRAGLEGELGRANLGWARPASARHPWLKLNPVTGKPIFVTKPQPEHVWLQRVDPQNALTAALMTMTAVHEFGHMLGLRHSHLCATMNPSWTECSPPHWWQFACRPLQPDDVRGAIALYGGHLRSLGPQRYCDYLPPPAPAVGYSGTYSSDDGLVHLSWTMPKGPDYLGTPSVGGYKVFMSSTCSTAPSTQIDQNNASSGDHVAITETPSRPGNWCVTVAIMDTWGRLSAPQQTTFVVPDYSQ